MVLFSTTAQGAGRGKFKCNLGTSKRLAKIKYSNQVFSYIENEKTYLNYNAFNTLKAVSPGILIDFHPTLTRKDHLQITLANESASAPINHRNTVIISWLDDNKEKPDGHMLPIPKCIIYMTTR
eukprot:6497919-Ditylum_brightwellii.AAC.1